MSGLASMNFMPDDIIENRIFNYLDSWDLFYSVRGVCSDWSKLMTNVWFQKIKEDMMKQVHSIDFVYEKEVLSKTYEFKIKFLVNYKNVLIMYSNNCDIIQLISVLLLQNEDVKIKQILELFFKFIHHDNTINTLFNDSSPEIIIQNLSENRQSILSTLDVFTSINLEISSDYTLHSIYEFKRSFDELDKIFYEQHSENSKLFYSFFTGVVEFQILRLEVLDVRKQIENLILRIQDTTENWPKKKNFYEKAYKILLYTKHATPNVTSIIGLFDKYKVKSPLVDFKQDSIKLLRHLRQQIKSNQIPQEQISQEIYECIIKRRVLLTSKILIMEKFHDIYEKIEKYDNYVKLNDVEVKMYQFVWCLKMSSNANWENLNVNSLLLTKRYLDEKYKGLFDKDTFSEEDSSQIEFCSCCLDKVCEEIFENYGDHSEKKNMNDQKNLNEKQLIETDMISNLSNLETNHESIEKKEEYDKI